MDAFLNALWRDDSGQDTIEYVLLALLIAVVSATIIFSLGENVKNGYQTTNTAVKNAIDQSGT